MNNKKAIEWTGEEEKFLSALTERKRNLIIKYYLALKRLYDILSYTDYIKMYEFVAMHKLNNNIVKVLREAHIVVGNGKQGKQARHTWEIEAPSLELAKAVVDRLAVISKNPKDESPLEYPPSLFDKKEESKEVNTVKESEVESINFVPVDIFEEHEMIREREVKIKELESLLKYANSEIDKLKKKEGELAYQVEVLEHDNARLKMISPEIKKTKFSFVWGLIYFEKIK